MFDVILRRAGRGLGYGLLTGEETGFSLGISLAIVGLLTVVTRPGALLLGLWQGRGRWVAVAVTAVLVVGVHLPEAVTVLTGDEAGALSPGRWLLLATVLTVWSAALALLLSRLVRWTQARPGERKTRPGSGEPDRVEGSFAQRPAVPLP